MYLIVDKGKLIESEVPKRNDEYALVDETTNHIFVLDLYDVIIVNKDKVDIGSKRVDRENLRLTRIDELSDILNSERPQIVTKDAERKMLDPYGHNFKPFTKAIMIAIKNNTRKRGLVRDDYDKILGLIREINKLADGSKDISVKKAEELLESYGLSISDIIKEEYL